MNHLMPTFAIPSMPTIGSWDVNVQNSTDGTLTLTDGFTINEAIVPAAPTLLLPANGSTLDDYTPTLDWSEPTYANRYHLIVDDNSDFSSPVYENTGLSSSAYTLPVSGLMDNITGRLKQKIL
jgi:hypothetical protein